jgi:formylglycine-generating enzyme required for sulfatase activity
MKRVFTAVLFLTTFNALVWANSAPVVSNVTASQRTDGSGIVDISYTMSDADNNCCTVSVVVSNNGGSTFTITPSSGALSGALTNVSPGRRQISWNSNLDLPGVFGSNYRIKVIAYDNYGPIGIVWVYINDDGSGMKDGNGNPINQGGFTGYISKYETTNAQYCQFLNDAKASNQITVYNNYVYTTSDTGHSQPYYNLAGPGYTHNNAIDGGKARINYTGSLFNVDPSFENHPVTYVSWYGATAFASYYGWRLPTEWEWQAVADYNGSYTYGHGPGTINTSLANYYGSYHPCGTNVVGTYVTTHGYGMCDMAGNIYEWTSTIYSGNSRVIRGAAWDYQDNYCKVGYRFYNDQLSMSQDLGFRVCRILEPSDIVWVTINNDPGVSGHEGFNGQMSKYETTNTQFCQYLNAAKASNQITVHTDNKVYATSDTSHSQPYYNLAGVGYNHDNATNGGAARINWTGSSFTVVAGFENHPVTYVSWHGAMAFAGYYGWRLPTEWEWQAVADYNGSYTYAHGPGLINNSLANYNGSLHPNGTSAVGAYGTIHGYGMCDMAGNVWEWTSTVSGSNRIIRGGHWDDLVNTCKVSFSYDYNCVPSYMTHGLGFRVCR